MKVIKLLIKTYGKQFLALTVSLSTVASQICRTVWSEPEEPSGLREFAKMNKN